MRVNIPELHDAAWFPPELRGFLTDAISFFATLFKPYRGVFKKLVLALPRQKPLKFIDLCSGAGGPALDLAEVLDKKGVSFTITLTDKHPNLPAFKAAAASACGKISCKSEPVDALCLPANLAGFRLMFASFHHFKPDQAIKILADAVEAGEGIAIFEYTSRDFLVWGIPLLLTPIFIAIATPFIRPWNWRRLLWTYLLPVLPFAVAWDGFASCMRTYSRAEMKRLTSGVGGEGYEWQIGEAHRFGFWPVAYLIGRPFNAGTNH